MPVVQLLACLKEECGLGQSTKQLLALTWHRLFASLTCEEGFPEARVTTDSHSDTSAVMRTLYHNLATSAILDGRHHYTVPDTTGLPVKRAACLPDEAFECLRRSRTMEEKEDLLPLTIIISFGPPNWSAPNADQLAVQYHDLELQSEMRKQGRCGLIPHTWLVDIADIQKMLVCHVNRQSKFHLVIGSSDNTATVAWPCKERNMESPHERCFEFSLQEASPTYISMCKLDDWLALPFNIKAPSWQQIKRPTQLFEAPAAIRIITTAKAPQLILKVAAADGFNDHPIQCMRNLADHLEVPRGDDDMFALSLNLTQSILGLSDDATLEKMLHKIRYMSRKVINAFDELIQRENRPGCHVQIRREGHQKNHARTNTSQERA